MNKNEQPLIKLKEELDQNDYESIKHLQKICFEKDQTTFKLEIDYKLQRAEGKVASLSKINEFMYFDKGNLVGYIGICHFGGDAIEVNGMVHPAYRRQGIFKKLFSLIREEWGKRESQKMLLLSDHKSVSGLEFIKYTRANYEHSEYDMHLRSDAVQDLTLNNMDLRKAVNKDAKEITRQNAVYFDLEFREEDIFFSEEEEKHGEFIYIAELDHIIVGKVHLTIVDGIGSIYGLGILPQYRGKGYGRELLTKSVLILKEKNITDIVLQVATKNKNALNLYQSCGFEESSIMDYYELTK